MGSIKYMKSNTSNGGLQKNKQEAKLLRGFIGGCKIYLVYRWHCSQVPPKLSWTIRERTEELVIHLKHNKFVVPSLRFLPSMKKKKEKNCTCIKTPPVPGSIMMKTFLKICNSKKCSSERGGVGNYCQWASSSSSAGVGCAIWHIHKGHTGWNRYVGHNLRLHDGNLLLNLLVNKAVFRWLWSQCQQCRVQRLLEICCWVRAIR